MVSGVCIRIRVDVHRKAIKNFLFAAIYIGVYFPKIFENFYVVTKICAYFPIVLDAILLSILLHYSARFHAWTEERPHDDSYSDGLAVFELWK